MSKFIFKYSENDKSDISSAEELFNDLKNRDPKIQHLWSHQADILRSYNVNKKEENIALELPTGTGKTLVGLIIGEWRRRYFRERVVYLCPTRQLAYQVGIKASEYGIDTNVFVGQQKNYNQAEFASYLAGESIAITNYSSLFNTNPRFNNPETIILDDAHAAENYIPKMWSYSISRNTNQDLYTKIVSLFSKDLPNYLLPNLLTDKPNVFQRDSLDMLPGPKLVDKVNILFDILDEASTKENKLIYPWQVIRDNLAVCNMFFSWNEILIRPFIPPTLTHEPFANAKQRVYMSATIGKSGDLERITGIPRIFRIPVPSGWEKQSIGRRLFIFPDRAFTEEQYTPWIYDFIRETDRVLVLTPNDNVTRKFIAELQLDNVDHEILNSDDVEESLIRFTDNQKAILALANRFDGIDLPGDSCRVMILLGLPTSVNLMEKFLWAKLGASAILRDRVQTRMTQAVGRCTRNSTDFALLLMLGTDLLEYCMKRENKIEFQPELRAEIEFGLDNSNQIDLSSYSELIRLFLSRSNEWNEAEKDILNRRDDSKNTIPEFIKVLNQFVNFEVLFQYDLWKGDYGSALEKATKISDNLSGNELSGYRAFWNYLTGCTAFLLGKEVNKDKNIELAANRFYKASQATKSITWYAKLSKEIKPEKIRDIEENDFRLPCANNIIQYIDHLGVVGPKFEKVISENFELIAEVDASKFDRGLTELGQMLGFNAEKPKGDGVPDSVWRLANQIVILFECKSFEKPENGISIRTCREAKGHQDWERANPFFSQHAELITIVVSPRIFLERNAAPHAEDLYYLNIDEIRNLFNVVSDSLRKIRSQVGDLEKEDKYDIVYTELSSAKLMPENILKCFTNRKLLDILEETV